MKKGRENKPHIGIFGRRNYGKSSFINAIAGQDIAIVSDTAGTTTDPVKKSVEIFGIGPAIMVDTAGIDDTGDLGQLRVRKTLQVIKTIDLAIILITGNEIGEFEEDLIKRFREYEVPIIFIHNKSDETKLDKNLINRVHKEYKTDVMDFSTMDNSQLDNVLELIKKHMPPTAYVTNSLLGGIIGKGDYVLLITPIDLEAPEGRMILPQVQVIRDVLDNGSINIVLKETELEHFLKTSDIKPRLAITDSQAFEKVSQILPDDIPLTGFSVLLARHKGPFKEYMNGTPKIGDLRDGDRVLILESCTHQVNCDDIGRYKIPDWLENHTGKKLEFDVVAGLSEFPNPITDYSLVVQCGGCMITRKQVSSRLKEAIDAGIPVTNYGMTIAYTNGIFDRAVEIFS
jgi:[FeFe] hydrogenase H-cluster maturation GTPase HydF